MSALLDHIRDIIRADGPISIARYMELALQHPVYGYYRKRNPLGAKGDFVTAPEISQMFGELIGLWCAEAWRDMGKPKEFVMLELGPGRGTLMQDALRATRKITGFHEALRLHLFESDEALRRLQEEKLGIFAPLYVDDLNHLPTLPTLIVANEFFDALPVHQLVEVELQGNKTLVERRVGLANDELVLIDVAEETQGVRKEGRVFEVSPLAVNFMKIVTQHILKNDGAALIVDYGYAVPSGSGTLAGISEHQYVDFLQSPGEIDISALVDFAALKQCALAENAKVYGPIGQGEFLQTIGIDIRTQMLKQSATEEQKKLIETSLHRLVDEEQMGTRFKVMALTSSNWYSVPGFS